MPPVSAPAAATQPPARYKLERDMLDPLARQVPSVLRLPAAPRMRVLREVDLGRVIPDLLIGVWRARTSAPARARSDYVEAHVLAALQEDGASTGPEIADRIRIAPARTLLALARLARRGAITATPGGAWVLHTPWSSGSAEVIAVEAKLERWRDALAQAASYLEFADRSYVVLDGARVAAVPAVLESFANVGVGLLLLTDGRLRLAARAIQFRPHSVRRVNALDRLFERSRTPVAAPRFPAPSDDQRPLVGA